jgi:streptomycin 3"-kinase
VFRRNDGAAFVKVSEGTGAAFLEEERRRTEWLAPFGLGSPTVLDWATSDDRAFLVTSAVPGMPASDLSRRQLSKAWPSIAERVRDVHRIPKEDCPFQRGLSMMFERAENVVARNAVKPMFLDPKERHVPPWTLINTVRAELSERLQQEADDLVVCHGDACMANFMIDPETLRCTGMIDLGRLGTADRYVDLAPLIGNTRETWIGTEDAQAAYKRLFDIHDISNPDTGRLAFYLRLDPLTWG